MYKGIYIALSGAVLKEGQLDILSTNLANSNTIAYKKQDIAFKDYLMSQEAGQQESPDGRTMSSLTGITTDFSGGSLRQTGNPLDIGLDGKGFIGLENNGFTRRGDLKLDKEGYLATFDGIKVLGESGSPIQIPSGKIEIGSGGHISVDGVQINKIRLVNFEDTREIIRSGGHYTAPSDAKQAAPDAAVQQGFLEMSNVDAMREMVEMIIASRQYEAYQKVVHSFDEAASRVTNDMPR